MKPVSCVICGLFHNNLWKDEPNRYCVLCEKIKKEFKGVISEIIPDKLYLGDALSPAHFVDGNVICVHENPEYCTKGLHLPILIKPPISTIDRSGAIASTVQLVNISHILIENDLNGVKTLVHCAGGVERSPLTLAYHLVNIGFKDTLEDAYDYLIEKRPIVSRRLSWLPEEVQE